MRFKEDNKEFDITATRQNNQLSTHNSQNIKKCVLINSYKMFNNIYKFELTLSSDMAHLYFDIY